MIVSIEDRVDQGSCRSRIVSIVSRLDLRSLDHVSQDMFPAVDCDLRAQLMERNERLRGCHQVLVRFVILWLTDWQIFRSLPVLGKGPIGADTILLQKPSLSSTPLPFCPRPP